MSVVQSPSDTARLETFADGVFAIAITLLILEIRLPASELHGETGLFGILASLWPSYLGYTVSFIVIGIGWMNHHNFLKLIDHTDHNFIVLNLFAASVRGIRTVSHTGAGRAFDKR